MLKGFKEFISQGNALELAVAVIIGAAFKPIVDAITNVIMAVISGVVDEPSFDNVFEFYVKDSQVQPGTILTAIINFLLIALAVYFCIVLPMNKFKERMKKVKDDKPAEPTEAELLVQIRDLLATGRPNASAGQPRPKA